MRSAALVLIVFVFPVVAYSAIIKVPKDYNSIQGAINAASHGDTVLVAPGTYVENIDFKGKAITVISDQGAGATIIDGNQAGTVVTFQSNEGLDTVLSGFTITNGSGTQVIWDVYGAGIICDGASPFITCNYLFNNRVKNTGSNANFFGGGIYCNNYATPIIENNLFEENHANTGGAIFLRQHSSAVIRQNTLRFNHAEKYFLSGGGGGIVCRSKSKALIENNIIHSNSANGGGGAIRCQGANVTIRYNDISHNGKKSIVCFTSKAFLIENNRITETTDGDAIYCFFATNKGRIINNFIAHTPFGSGIYLEGADPHISGNVIIDNASDSGAGIFMTAKCKSWIINNTLAWNKASSTVGSTKSGSASIFPVPG